MTADQAIVVRLRVKAELEGGLRPPAETIAPFAARHGITYGYAKKLLNEHRRGGVRVEIRPTGTVDRAGLELFIATAEAETLTAAEIARRFGVGTTTVGEAWLAVRGCRKPRTPLRRPKKRNDDCGVPDDVAAVRLAEFYETEAAKRTHRVRWTDPVELRPLKFHQPLPEGHHR